MQSDLERNQFITPALYASEVTEVTPVQTSSDNVIIIDQSNNVTSNIQAPDDSNTDIKVGSSYNVINVNNGNSTIITAGNAMNIINIGNANTTINVEGRQK